MLMLISNTHHDIDEFQITLHFHMRHSNCSYHLTHITINFMRRNKFEDKFCKRRMTFQHTINIIYSAKYKLDGDSSEAFLILKPKYCRHFRINWLKMPFKSKRLCHKLYNIYDIIFHLSEVWSKIALPKTFPVHLEPKSEKKICSTSATFCSHSP